MRKPPCVCVRERTLYKIYDISVCVEREKERTLYKIYNISVCRERERTLYKIYDICVCRSVCVCVCGEREKTLLERESVCREIKPCTKFMTLMCVEREKILYKIYDISVCREREINCYNLQKGCCILASHNFARLVF